tara:strand:- start:358 stop:1512 length:1155 start_codon:yes stop_codon:yes gene_type:complete
MKKRNVAIVIYSRANYARIKSLVVELKKSKKINLSVIIGASALLDKYGNLESILKKEKIKITAKTYSIVQGDNPLTMAKSTGLGIVELSQIFSNINPDIVVTVADRFETMATAITSTYMNITLAHTQGGEVTGSIDESVRHAITKMAHIHFPATKKSRDRIIKMGENKKNVFLTGCPSLDLINKKKLKFDKTFFKNFNYVGNKIDFKKKYLVILYHPVTTQYELEKRNTEILLNVAKKIDYQVIWFWPNIDAGSDNISKSIRIFREKNKTSKLSFVKNLPPEEFLKVIFNSECFIGNSSAALREGSYLGIPSVSVGNRQKPREHGFNVIFSKINENELINKIKLQINRKKKILPSNLFGDGNAAKKIVKILENVKVDIQKKLSY